MIGFWFGREWVRFLVLLVRLVLQRVRPVLGVLEMLVLQRVGRWPDLGSGDWVWQLLFGFFQVRFGCWFCSRFRCLNGGLVLQKRLGLGELGLALEWLSLGPVLQKRWRQRRLGIRVLIFFGFLEGDWAREKE